MQQIKLFKETFNKFSETANQFSPEETVQSPRKKQSEHLQLIQPWLEDSDSNPFINLKSKENKKRQIPIVKKVASLTLMKQWRSVQKISNPRQSKRLPILDVGHFNTIRKNFNTTRVRSKLDMNPLSLQKISSKETSSRQITLPSVQRQLNIERKIFLLKTESQPSSSSPSPLKGSRIRKIIGDKS